MSDDHPVGRLYWKPITERADSQAEWMDIGHTTTDEMIISSGLSTEVDGLAEADWRALTGGQITMTAPLSPAQCASLEWIFTGQRRGSNTAGYHRCRLFRTHTTARLRRGRRYWTCRG